MQDTAARTPRAARPGRPSRTSRWRRPRRAAVTILSVLIGGAAALPAQTIVSVPFTNGFIGTRGSSAGSSNNVLTYATLGIARAFFIQSSSSQSFELQGNDIPGTLRIVRTNGTTLEFPASANWRNSGGSTFLIGILPRPASPITYSYAGGSIQITDGSVQGGSSIGAYIAGYTGSVLSDGNSTSGNAAQSQVLSGLNTYLSTVIASRPAGPVTVTSLSTSSTTPTLTGTATLVSGEDLSVVIGGVQYTASSSPSVSRNGNSWSLQLTTPLALGTYSITATIGNANGFTLSDGTTNELTITPQTQVLTVSGTLTANDKVYDGALTASGTLSGLTLSGVSSGDDVTIASVTLQFQFAGAGGGITVGITALTLGGADASQYTVSLTGAPTAAASITARPLSISGVSVTNRGYNGSTVATLVGVPVYTGLAAGESFAVSGTPGASFTTASVGAAKAITVVGFTAPTANYALTQPTGLTASITAAPLTIGGSFTVTDKVQDGTVTATIAVNSLTLTGVVSGDTVALTGVTAAFADTSVGAAKPVSLAAAALTGSNAANYTVSLAGAPTTTAAITSPVPPSTPPSAPQNVTSVAGDGSVTVSWTAPATPGCSPLTGFWIEYSTNAGATWTRVTLTSGSLARATVNGLTNNLAYVVRVAAVNNCASSAFTNAATTVVPIGPTRNGGGTPITSPPGTGTVTTGGVTQPVRMLVLRDTTLQVSATPLTLSLRAGDADSVAIPIDSTGTLRFDIGGTMRFDGSGYQPGTFVTLYSYMANGPPLLLGQVLVAGDGTFTTAFPVPASLVAGSYTLQVNGINGTGVPASAAIGVVLDTPPPDLLFTSTIDQLAPAVGDTTAITLDVRNRGSGPAIDVLVPRAFEEPGLRILLITPRDGTYDALTHVWTIPRIDPGATARLVLTVLVLRPAAAVVPPAGATP